MSKIVYLFNRNWIPNENDVDAFLIPVKGLSTRSSFELELEEIVKIKKQCRCEIYLLCDALIAESEIENLTLIFNDIFSVADKVFFQDLSFVNLAYKFNVIDKLVYYSPTLAVSNLEILQLKKMGLKHIFISKEANLNDYNAILDECSDVKLGMLGFGYPQIYFSKRRMISSYKAQYMLDISTKNKYFIKEKGRTFYQPIIEDERGTYIFAAEIYFPYKHINQFIEKGIEYILFDSIFIDEVEERYKLFIRSIKDSIKEDEIDFSCSDFMLNKEMVNDYDKKN